MKQAQFGRMSMGRCVKMDMGYCATNVLGLMDQKCSGRNKCEVKILDPDLYEEISSTCKEELTPYLEASYECREGTKFTCTIMSSADACI